MSLGANVRAKAPVAAWTHIGENPILRNTQRPEIKYRINDKIIYLSTQSHKKYKITNSPHILG